MCVLVVSVETGLAALADNLAVGRLRSVATQILVLQIAVVLLSVIAGTVITYSVVTALTDREFEHRSLAIGHAVAETPDVVEAFALPNPSKVIQPIAEAIRKSTGASFIVVANADALTDPALGALAVTSELQDKAEDLWRKDSEQPAA